MNTMAVINIARQQLGMEESDYRALLLRVGKSDSLRSMTEGQRLAVVDELKRLGFKVKASGKKLPLASKPYTRLVHALWKSCHRKGVIEDGSRQALRTFVKKRSGVDDPDFLTFDQANPIIDALKAMEARG
ncbi:regulatory protein GemA [Rhizobium pusense]|uniref:regulatory protein GemA n=1 Tax=Agrobacterium pusense TaxID=648995 RepID=UPI002449ECFA|nr:regulatory protein GemA [Agrobacterium pusense]MDH1094705.1 regulatory protein GemA [Agrobacterium pusense]MDH1111370.1 regulatory protein GemA [Agrobacterium pusense]MDH2192685.1 regulatory protein GemA [Agrobacterium pusense]